MNDLVGPLCPLIWTIDILEGLIVEAGLADEAPIESFDLMVAQWTNNSLMGDFFKNLPGNEDSNLRDRSVGPIPVYLDREKDFCAL
jgi:hypothetical protein